MELRRYQDGDFARLYAIEEVCFQPPLRFGRGMMRQLVDSAVAATWIAEEDGVMMGFAIVEWTVDPGLVTAYIPTIEVLPVQRRSGVGAELLRRLEMSAADAGAGLIWLHVDVENDRQSAFIARQDISAAGGRNIITAAIGQLKCI